MDGFQIIKSEDSFLFENKIGSSAISGIGQYIDTIAMLYGLSGSIDQVVEVITLLADGTENMVFTLYRMKLAFENYQFQLIDELSTFQRM